MTVPSRRQRPIFAEHMIKVQAGECSGKTEAAHLEQSLPVAAPHGLILWWQLHPVQVVLHTVDEGSLHVHL